MFHSMLLAISVYSILNINYVVTNPDAYLCPSWNTSCSGLKGSQRVAVEQKNNGGIKQINCNFK